MNNAGSHPTPRLRLRPVEEADLPLLFDHQRDPAAVHMAAFVARDPEDRAAFDAHWARMRTDPAVTMRIIEADGDLVGHVASFEQNGTREVTYWIGREHWGRGFATRALRRLIADEVRPLKALTAVDNVASRRVLEKCGFVVCGRERGFANGRGTEVEEFVLRLDAAPVRRATPGDEALLRRVRLDALADAPRAFDSTIERERVRSSADWRSWISDGATFILESPDGPKGLAAGVVDRDDAAAALLVSMWAHPDVRGTGAADALARAVIGWAEAKPLPVIRLHVLEDDFRARAFYERTGFRDSGARLVRERDGAVEVEMHLLLPRRPLPETSP